MQHTGVVGATRHPDSNVNEPFMPVNHGLHLHTITTIFEIKVVFRTDLGLPDVNECVVYGTGNSGKTT